jgi:hypothetical protein
MTPAQLFVYTDEVCIHAELAISNYITFGNIVHEEKSRQTREAWMYLQSFLSHFGMVSKLLYAPSARQKISKDRAKELREYLETDNTSALNDRDARNAVEHLDERMDNWLSVEGKGFLESVFQNKEAYEYLDSERWLVRRVFLVDEAIFITQEQDGIKEMALGPIEEELYRIIKVCRDKLDNHNPYYIVQPGQG